jgi:photosystem II stability/assembly factor-like uncharacterized protein
MRTQRRTKQQSVVAVLIGVLAAGAVVLLGSMRSVTKDAPAQDASLIYLPPENEAAEHRAGTANPDEMLDLKQSSNAFVSAEQVRRAQAQAAAVPAAASGIAWQQLGPFNIGGRVTDVVADRFTPNTAFAAVSGGGIWKTTDGGANWVTVWPDANTQAMGAFAQAQDGALWAGTGEANPPGGGLTYFGDGVYKSTDNGAHWENTGLTQSESIGRIAIDPKNPSRVFVAAAGHVARSAGQRGLYRTDDAGKTWKLVLAPPNATTGAIDVAINPANPSIVYASLWDHRRTNGTRNYGGVGSGLFRSKDGGETWTRLQNVVDPLPAYDLEQTGLTENKDLGRIGVAIAPSNPNRIYVLFGGRFGADKGFYVSDDGGDTFKVGGRAGGASSFEWWFGRVWVDPDDQNHLFSADVSLRTSTNGGTTWSTSGSVHADQHGMDWDRSTLDGNPATPNRVFLGNDGGMYRSENSGVANSWVKATNQPWNQSYHLAISKQDPSRLLTGLQDNGSNRSWTPANPSPSDPQLKDWNSSGGGDGHWNNIDPTDQTYYYSCSQSSGGGTHSCGGRHDTATTTQNTTVAQTTTPGQRYTTDAPIVYDPNVPPKAADGTQPPNAVYVGGNYVLRSLNRGVNVTVISPIDTTPANPSDDTEALPGKIPPEEIDTGLYTNLYGAVTAMAPAKSPTPVPYASVIYAGTDTGLVWKTSDAGAHWTQMLGLPTRWVNMIIADPDNADHAYIAFSGFRQGDDAANVWETGDGGASWHNISQNMPNGPVEMIEYDAKGNVLFAATDVGVFDHKDGDTSWYKVSVGMPQVPVLDVKLSGDGRYLFAATFGRSVWKLPLFVDATDGGGPGGSVPATLSLSLGPNASFGTFTPGVGKDYSAQTTANVISTAGDAALSFSDPGHLTNGAFSLPQPLVVELSKSAWTGPASNDPVTIGFKQRIDANDPLRTGSYSKTITFTLSTTNP